MGLSASTPISTNAVRANEEAGSGGNQGQQSTVEIAREATDKTEVSVGAETSQFDQKHDKQKLRDKQSKYVGGCTIEQIIGTGNSKSKEAAMRVNRLHFKLVDHASSKESFMEEQMAGRTNGIMEEQMAKVTNGIFLGGEKIAYEIDFLQQHNISCIVNVTSAGRNYYPNVFEYYVIKIFDHPDQDIKQYFWKAILFIRTAIRKNKNVLVHCQVGISRSVTIILAYLMFYEELSLEEALQKVRRVRYYANPNSGFINQLKQFEYELKLNKGSLDDCIKNKNIKNL